MGFIDELKSYKKDMRPVHFKDSIDLMEKAAEALEEVTTALETIMAKLDNKEPLSFEYRNKILYLCRKIRRGY